MTTVEVSMHGKLVTFYLLVCSGSSWKSTHPTVISMVARLISKNQDKTDRKKSD